MGQMHSILSREIARGIFGKYIHGNDITFGYIDLEGGSSVQLHQHPNEQITFVLEGALEMEIGGEKVILMPGDYFIIPSNTPHRALAKERSKVIDVFNPVREDYK